MANKPSGRFWELDFLRGIAISLMVAFHAAYDLENFFGVTGISTEVGFWHYLARITATLFIALAGVNTALIHQRHGFVDSLKKNLRRAGRLLLLAMAITITTWMFDSEKTIWFGMLHFLGAAIFISVFFARFKWLNLLFMAAAFGLGEWFQSIRLAHPWALPLGLRPFDFQTFDYYPFFPWFSAILLGLLAGQVLYCRPQGLIQRSPRSVERGLIFLGRYSLWIYFLHQPVLLAIPFLIFRFFV